MPFRRTDEIIFRDCFAPKNSFLFFLLIFATKNIPCAASVCPNLTISFPGFISFRAYFSYRPNQNPPPQPNSLSLSSSLLDAKGEIINLHIHLGISYVTQINGTAVNHMSKGVSIEKANFQIYDK